MGKNKLGIFIVLGAITGAMVSLLDRSTREQVAKQVKGAISKVRFYSENPETLKSKVMEKKDQIQSMVEQFSDDASYVKEKIDELKLLTPQVKDLVVETKDAFIEAKDEYKSIVNEEQEKE